MLKVEWSDGVGAGVNPKHYPHQCLCGEWLLEEYTHCFNLGAASPVKRGCYPKQLDVIMKNYRMIILEWKGSFKSFGPTPFSIQVKKLMPRHLLKPSKLFYGRAKIKIVCFIILLDRNWDHNKG